MNKKIFALVVVLVISLAGGLFMLFFNNEKLKLTDEELNWISENNNEIFFMGYYDSPGESKFVEKLCMSLSKDTSLKIVPYEDTWENNIYLLSKGKLPMVSTMNITPKRNEYTLFTSSFKGISSGIYAPIENSISTYKDISFKNIGIIKNVELLDDFTEKYPKIHFNTVFYDDLSSMIIGIEKKEIDGFISTKNYDQSMSVYHFFEIPTISKNNNHIGIHKDYPYLASIMSKEVDYIKSTGWSDIVKDAISFELEKQSIGFDNKELKYISNNPVITVGFIQDYMPYSYRDEYQMMGILPEIFEKMEYLLDARFSYYFDTYENLIKNDEIQIILDVSNSNSNFMYSHPLFKSSLIVVGKQEKPYIKQMYDLESYRVASVTQNPMNKIMLEEMPYINITAYSNYLDMIKLLKDDKIDYIIIPDIIANIYLSKETNITRKGIIDETIHYLSTKNKSDVALISIINKCVAVIDVDSIIINQKNLVENSDENRKTILTSGIFIIGFLLTIIINLMIKRRKTELELIYTERMTGVKNKLWLEKKIKKSDNSHIFFQLELKNFGLLKERYGTEFYDKCIRKATKAVAYNITDKEIFACIEKEKFVIGFLDLDENKMMKFANNLSKLFSEKIFIQNMIYNFEGYVGILTHHDDIQNFENIMECLDIATVYSRKKDRPVKYTYDLFIKYNDEMNFDKEFISLVVKEKIDVLYQSVFSKNSGKVFALDTYATCKLGEFGKLTHNNFKRSVQKLQLKTQVDKIVLAKIVDKILSFEKKGIVIKIMVDISSETIAKKNFIPWLKEMTREIKNSKLIIKIDNTSFENNNEKLTFTCSENIEFLMVDFNNSATSLMDFDEDFIDIISIDTDFLLNLSENELYEDGLDYIISVAKKLKKRVMVSEITLKNQFDIINKKDVDFISGKFLRRHLSEEETEFENINSRR